MGNPPVVQEPSIFDDPIGTPRISRPQPSIFDESTITQRSIFDDPVDSLMSPEPPPLTFIAAKRRGDVMRRQNIEQLRILANAPNVSAERLKHLNYLINLFEHEDVPTGDVLDLAKGLIPGLVQGAMDVADLVAAVGSVARLPGARSLRDQIQDAQAILRDEFGDTTAARFGLGAGRMASMFVPYGIAGGVTARAAIGLAPKSRIGRAFLALGDEQAMKGLGGYATRWATNMMGGLGLDALRAATLPGATKEQKLRQFALDTGMSVLGAGVIELAPVQRVIGFGIKKVTSTVKREPTSTKADRAAYVDEAVAQGQHRRELNLTRRQAEKLWETTTNTERTNLLPGVDDVTLRQSFKDLTDEQRDTIVERFIQEIEIIRAIKKTETNRLTDDQVHSVLSNTTDAGVRRYRENALENLSREGITPDETITYRRDVEAAERELAQRGKAKTAEPSAPRPASDATGEPTLPPSDTPVARAEGTPPRVDYESLKKNDWWSDLIKVRENAEVLGQELVHQVENGNPEALGELLHTIGEIFEGKSNRYNAFVKALKDSFGIGALNRARNATFAFKAVDDDVTPAIKEAVSMLDKALDAAVPSSPKEALRLDLSEGDNIIAAGMRAMRVSHGDLTALDEGQLRELVDFIDRGIDRIVERPMVDRNALEQFLLAKEVVEDLRLDKIEFKTVDQPGKALSEMSMDELDALKLKLMKAHEKGDFPPGDEAHDLAAVIKMHNKLTDDIDRIPKAILEGRMVDVDRPDPGNPIDPRNYRTTHSSPDPDAPISQMSKPEYQKLVHQLRREPIELSDVELAAMYDQALNDLNVAKGEKNPDVARQHKKILAEVINEQDARIKRQSQDGIEYRYSGFAANAKTATSGSVVGFFIGMTEGDSIEERIRNGLLTAAAFGIAAGSFSALRSIKTPKTPFTKALGELKSRVKSIEDTPDASKGLLSRVEKLYYENVSRSYPLKKLYGLLGQSTLPFKMNAAKQLEMFGLWKRQADAAMFIKPFKVLDNGDIVDADALSLVDVAKMVNGNTEDFGSFLIAARSIEMYAKQKGTPPVEMALAREVFVNAPDHYLEAQKELLKYSRWLGDVGVEAGLISPEMRVMFEEDIFYVPLIRLFQEGLPTSKAAVPQTAKQAKSVAAPQPFKALQTSDRQVLNGFEAVMENTPTLLRHAEFNRMLLNLADAVEHLRTSGRKDLVDYFMVPINAKGIHGKQQPGMSAAQTHKRMADMKQAMADLGTPMSDAEAARISRMFGTEPVDATSGVVTLWRNGIEEKWRMHEDLAMAFRSLNSDEFEGVLKFIGFPAQLARVGITASPRFIAWQAFRDNFQFWLNSPDFLSYVPFVDQARGWWHIVSGSPEYQRLVQAGLTGESMTAEALNPFRTPLSRSKSTLRDIQVGKGTKLTEKLAASVKEMSIRKFYTDLVMPIADAARVGTYLRGRGRGESVMDAVYTAKKIGVNYGERGAGRVMHNLNHTTLFLNPSFQSIRTSAEAFKRNPLMYLTKGIVSVALPSYYIWHAYQDDEEIQELRQTEAGRRYWWVRDPDGDIRKVPKPILDGQLFGGPVEAWLDRTKAENPRAVQTWLKALGGDAALHLLPTMGSVPVSIAANYNVQFGGPLVSQSDENLDPELQANRGTTDAARIVGSSVSSFSSWAAKEAPWVARAMSPVGVDFLVRNIGGEVSHEVFKAMGQAYMFLTEPGYTVDAEEAPFISSLYPRFPTTGANSLREFYDHARNLERIYNTGQRKLQGYDPEDAFDYITKRNVEYSLAKNVMQIRSELADLRAGIQDIEDNKDLYKSERREVTDEIIRMMITRARVANEALRDMIRQQP